MQVLYRDARLRNFLARVFVLQADEYGIAGLN